VTERTIQRDLMELAAVFSLVVAPKKPASAGFLMRFPVELLHKEGFMFWSGAGSLRSSISVATAKISVARLHLRNSSATHERPQNALQ
jgi:hypothetical protein